MCFSTSSTSSFTRFPSLGTGASRFPSSASTGTRHRARKAITLLAQQLLGRGRAVGRTGQGVRARRVASVAHAVNLAALPWYARRLPRIRDVAAKEQAQSLSNKGVVDAALIVDASSPRCRCAVSVRRICVSSCRA